MSLEGVPSGLEGFKQCFTTNGRFVTEHMKLCDPSLLAEKTKEQSLLESKFVLVIVMLLSSSFY